MFKRFKYIILTLLLILLGRGYYVDSLTVSNARLVITELNEFCKKHKIYPDQLDFNKITRKYEIDNKEWLLFTSMDKKKGTLQYPMNLYHFNAPGKHKLSEFMPTVYAYTVTNPCKL